MAQEQQTIPTEAAFLKKQEELLELAKNGDKAALAELKHTNSPETSSSFQEKKQTAEAMGKLPAEHQVIAPELKPSSDGVSPAVNLEANEMSGEMLTKMMSGDLDLTDPDAITRAMIEMAKKRSESKQD